MYLQVVLAIKTTRDHAGFSMSAGHHMVMRTNWADDSSSEIFLLLYFFISKTDF